MKRLTVMRLLRVVMMRDSRSLLSGAVRAQEKAKMVLRAGIMGGTCGSRQRRTQ